MTNTVKLKQIVADRGLDAMDLAHKTRIPYGHIVKLLNGGAMFRTKEMDRFCEVLRIPVEERSAIFFAEKVAESDTK